jgi:hypothetical protein
VEWHSQKGRKREKPLAILGGRVPLIRSSSLTAHNQLLTSVAQLSRSFFLFGQKKFQEKS